MPIKTIQHRVETLYHRLTNEMESFTVSIKQQKEFAEVKLLYDAVKTTMQELRYKMKHYESLITEEMEKFTSNKE